MPRSAPSSLLRRHVEVYNMGDVESELALDRSGLIAMAQLLGSDYTDGVHGVGIVNAMETYARGTCNT